MENTELWFRCRQDQVIFLSPQAPRLALGSNKFAIQWVSRMISLGVKRPGPEAGHSPPPSAFMMRTGTNSLSSSVPTASLI